MNNNTSKKADLIGMVNPRMDVKVGEHVEVRSIAGYRRGTVPAGAVIVEDLGAIVEVLETHTIVVESVDAINGHLWCKGPYVEGKGSFSRGTAVYLGAL